MPAMHFRCLVEVTVVFLRKYFDLYRFINKICSYIGKILYRLLTSPSLCSSCYSSAADLQYRCILLLSVTIPSLSDKLCSSSVIVFCSTNWDILPPELKCSAFFPCLGVQVDSQCFYSVLPFQWEPAFQLNLPDQYISAQGTQQFVHSPQEFFLWFVNLQSSTSFPGYFSFSSWSLAASEVLILPYCRIPLQVMFLLLDFHCSLSFDVSSFPVPLPN